MSPVTFSPRTGTASQRSPGGKTDTSFDAMAPSTGTEGHFVTTAPQAVLEPDFRFVWMATQCGPGWLQQTLPCKAHVYGVG
jgi:hypothetical protein